MPPTPPAKPSKTNSRVVVIDLWSKVVESILAISTHRPFGNILNGDSIWCTKLFEQVLSTTCISNAKLLVHPQARLTVYPQVYLSVDPSAYLSADSAHQAASTHACIHACMHATLNASFTATRRTEQQNKTTLLPICRKQSKIWKKIRHYLLCDMYSFFWDIPIPLPSPL